MHVALTGLPTARVLAAAVLSDAIRGLWVYRADDRVRLEPGPYEMPLGFSLGADRSRADLHFAPYRDETGTTLTLRLIFQDGETTVAQFAGGACDPSRRVPAPSPSSVVARPGDDLNDLANRFGTVKLAPGTYRLARPLVLNHPVTLTAERPGTTLLFAQGPGDPALDRRHQGPRRPDDPRRLRRPLRRPGPLGPEASATARPSSARPTTSTRATMS